MSYKTSKIKTGSPKISGYTIVRRIGDGGMSVVYLALQESLKRHVALKIMRVQGEVDEEMSDRFIHEAETIAQLDHPNIVSIHDVGQAPDGSLFYSMPFLDHGDLRSFSPDSDRQLIELFQSLCNGLAYAHKHDVVHRDVKPENVLFDKFGTARIADFGIAVTGGNRRWTKEGEVIGSAHYMSPEQCQAGSIDARSDVYSLGVMLFEILTGKVPFDAAEEVSIMLAQVSDPLPVLPVELKHWQPLVGRCLSKSPNQRFQSAEELKQALGRVPTRPLAKWMVRIRVIAQETWRRWRRRLWQGLVATTVTAAVLAAVYFWRLANAPLPEDSPLVLEQTPATPAMEPDVVPAADAVAESQPIEETIDLPTEPVEPPAISSDEALQLVEQGMDYLAQDRLTRPAGDNAAERFVAVLEVYSDHPQAMDGVSALSIRYDQLITASINAQEYAAAAVYADSLVGVWQRTGLGTERFPLVASSVLEAVARAVTMEVNRIDAPSAVSALQVARTVVPSSERLPDLWALIDELPEDGQILSDSLGLDTIVVPRILTRGDGRSRQSEHGFAISPTEVTVAAYRDFADQRGWPESSCRRGEAPALFRSRNWREPGIEMADDHPVICVSWQDAVAFAEWLSARSGNLYRLPNETEWLHAAWSGHNSESACETGNVGGTETAHFVTETLNCSDEVVFTAPVGQFLANRLGLQDLRGNVREWVLDCAPTDTGFNTFLDKLNLKEADRCERRTVRGTSWLDGRGTSMMGSVDYVDDKDGRSYIGFRVVRDLFAERERDQSR